MPEIEIKIKTEGDGESASNFTSYQDAINFLSALEDEEMDARHAKKTKEKWKKKCQN